MSRNILAIINLLAIGSVFLGLTSSGSHEHALCESSLPRAIKLITHAVNPYVRDQHLEVCGGELIVSQ